MHEHEQARRHQREHGHRLGKAVDRFAPVGMHQVQYRRQQGTGVAHADPENEGGDVQTPHMRVVHVGHAHAFNVLVNFAADANAEHQQGTEQDDPVQLARVFQALHHILVDLRPGYVFADIFSHFSAFLPLCLISRYLRAPAPDTSPMDRGGDLPGHGNRATLLRVPCPHAPSSPALYPCPAYP